MEKENTDFKLGRFFLAFMIFTYVISYTLVTLKFLIMSYQGDFSFLPEINSTEVGSSDSLMTLALFTIFGAILGGSTLGIISLHRYSAIEKSLDIDHIWGYLMAPILSIIIGILIFCFLQSGIFVLTGESETINMTKNIKIGYLSLGAICSYNWDVFIMKLQKLSSRIKDA